MKSRRSSRFTVDLESGDPGNCRDCTGLNVPAAFSAQASSESALTSATTAPSTVSTNSSTTSQPSSLYFRKIQPCDRRQIQSLHETWFPVSYHQDFYDDMVKGKMFQTGEDLYTNAAIERPARNVCSSTATMSTPLESSTESFCKEIDGEMYANQKEKEQSTMGGGEVEEKIVACIVAAIIPARRLNQASRNLLLPLSFRRRHVAQPPPHHRQCTDNESDDIEDNGDKSSPHNCTGEAKACYIMTLGTIESYRKTGLATRLVQQCIQDLVSKDPSCGALYLHVMTTNSKAIQFYEKPTLAFWRVQEIQNYYSIDGKLHSCYLYAKYFHGNRGHLDVLQILLLWVSLAWRQIQVPLGTWWRGMTGNYRLSNGNSSSNSNNNQGREKQEQ